MMIRGDNPDVDQHVLTIGKLYVSISESGCLAIDASVKGHWKASACFIAGDYDHFRCLLAELEIYANGRLRSDPMGGLSLH
jgi:hypothetical protein